MCLKTYVVSVPGLKEMMCSYRFALLAKAVLRDSSRSNPTYKTVTKGFPFQAVTPAGIARQLRPWT